MKMSIPWRVLLALGCVSLASAFIGATLALWWVQQQDPEGLQRVVERQDSMPEHDLFSAYHRHLTRYLQLESEQAVALQEIIEEARVAKNLTGVGGWDAIRDSLDAEVRTILNPEQLRRYERFESMRERFRERRDVEGPFFDR